jgi:hypothetical protein
LGALSSTGSIQHKGKTGVRRRIGTNHNGRYIYIYIYLPLYIYIGSHSLANPHSYVHKPNVVNYKCNSSSKKVSTSSVMCSNSRFVEATNNKYKNVSIKAP